MLDLKTGLTILQIFLAFGNSCIMIFAFVKFLGKPKATLENRISAVELEVKEIKASLLQGNDRFREQESKFEEQDEINSVLLGCMMALIEFEMQYCITEHKEMSEGLRDAKNDLNDLLSKKNRKRRNHE